MSTLSPAVPPKNALFRHSVRYALRGVVFAWQSELNLRRQAVIGVLAIVLALLLGLSGLEIAIVLIVSGAVMMGELFNSALEALANAAQPNFHPYVQQAKDMAAGAVLLMSVTAVVVGLLVLGIPLVQLLAQW